MSVHLIEKIKVVHKGTQLGLRASKDISERYPHLSGEEIVAKVNADATAAFDQRRLETLPIVSMGWWVESLKFPQFSGYHKRLDADVVKKLETDPSATMDELVRMKDAANYTNTLLKLKD